MSRPRKADKVDLLKGAGFEIKTPLPAAYQDAIDSLTPQEIEILIKVKGKFDRAQAKTTGGVAPYTTYVVPF